MPESEPSDSPPAADLAAFFARLPEDEAAVLRLALNLVSADGGGGALSQREKVSRIKARLVEMAKTQEDEA